MADREPACVADVRALLGEGPVWVEREQALYWVDLKGYRILRLNAPGDWSEWPTPIRIGSIAPRAAGGFVAGTEDGFAFVDLDEGRFEVFANPDEERPGNRFNDGKTDARGRFWAGTMVDREREASGRLYRLDADLSWRAVDEGYRVTNGPAFDHRRGRMYHSDSALQRIYAFDVHTDGSLGERSLFAQFGEGDGFPDGMTADSDGCLWVAFWDGWCVRRISPEGAVMEDVRLPVQRPTSCAFGGPDLDRLYVTSARIDLDEEALRMQPCAGGLFLVEPGVRGVAQAPFAG
jgi:sugar lactone lactonase YvrE